MKRKYQQSLVVIQGKYKIQSDFITLNVLILQIELERQGSHSLAVVFIMNNLINIVNIALCISLTISGK